MERANTEADIWEKADKTRKTREAKVKAESETVEKARA